MRPRLTLKGVRGRHLARLHALYRTTRCPRTRLRVQMVLLSRQGYSLTEIAKITGQSDETVRRWLHRFLSAGCAGLQEAARAGRPPAITPAVEQFLRDCLRQTPREFGLHRPSWTTALLATVVRRRFKIQVTDECIRQHLQRIDAVCRRPTWTVKHLAVQRPGYAQQKGALTRLLNHPPRGADVYVQDEAELSLFPTLTRMWMFRGEQRKIRAPGVHPPKRHECAATDWRTGTIVRIRSEKRNAKAFCRLVEKCLTRSARRKRRAIIVVDRARIHTPEGSRLVAELLKTYGRRLRLR